MSVKHEVLQTIYAVLCAPGVGRPSSLWDDRIPDAQARELAGEIVAALLKRNLLQTIDAGLSREIAGDGIMAEPRVPAKRIHR